jgi:hypothetical protein
MRKIRVLFVVAGFSLQCYFANAADFATKGCRFALGYGLTLADLSQGNQGPQPLIFRSEVYDPAESAGYSQWAAFHVLADTWQSNGSADSYIRTLEPYFDTKKGQLLLTPATYRHIEELEQVYNGYGTKIDGKLQEIVRNVEINKLVISRQSNFSAKGFFDNKLKGFLRVYDGTDYFKLIPKNPINGIGKYRNQFLRPVSSEAPRINDSPLTPVELIMQELNIKLTAIQKLRDRGHPIFELGTYTLHGTKQEKLETKLNLWNWFFHEYDDRNSLERDYDNRNRFTLANYENRYDKNNTIFICHVGTEAHRIAFEKEFGFSPLPSSETPGIRPPEYILAAKYSVLMAHVKNIIEQTKDALGGNHEIFNYRDQISHLLSLHN